MERLDATVEELGKTGQFADVARRYAVLEKMGARPAGREDRDAAGLQRSREFDDAGPVVDRDERRLAELSRQAPSPSTSRFPGR